MLSKPAIGNLDSWNKHFQRAQQYQSNVRQYSAKNQWKKSLVLNETMLPQSVQTFIYQNKLSKTEIPSETRKSTSRHGTPILTSLDQQKLFTNTVQAQNFLLDKTNTSFNFNKEEIIKLHKKKQLSPQQLSLRQNKQI